MTANKQTGNEFSCRSELPFLPWSMFSVISAAVEIESTAGAVPRKKNNILQSPCLNAACRNALAKAECHCSTINVHTPLSRSKCKNFRQCVLDRAIIRKGFFTNFLENTRSIHIKYERSVKRLRAKKCIHFPKL